MAAHFGSRLRKGAVTTTVAALAVAALTASQAPDTPVEEQGRPSSTGAQPVPDLPADETASGNSRYYTDLPPLKSPAPAPASGTTPPATTGDSGGAGIPATVLDAYKKAAAELAQTKPGCNLPWELLAAIGQVESGQARGGKVDADGTTIGKILGPKLDGNGFAHISDTDHGAYDGDTTVDRAVGPMQFIPSTWAWAAATATPTEQRTRTTSTTPRSPPATTCAAPTGTWPPTRACVPRSSATTTPPNT
ncbi:hypothetical protein GCM10020256_58840 [Streptomyces thermocoprophilus]